MNKQDVNIATLEANQRTILRRLDRQEARMDRLLHFAAIGVGGGVIVTLVGAIIALVATS